MSFLPTALRLAAIYADRRLRIAQATAEKRFPPKEGEIHQDMLGSFIRHGLTREEAEAESVTLVQVSLTSERISLQKKSDRKCRQPRRCRNHRDRPPHDRLLCGDKSQSSRKAPSGNRRGECSVAHIRGSSQNFAIPPGRYQGRPSHLPADYGNYVQRRATGGRRLQRHVPPGGYHHRVLSHGRVHG